MSMEKRVSGSITVGESKLRKVNIPLLAIWLIVFLFYSYLAFTLPHRSSFLSPDENNTFCVARQIHENHTIFIHSTLNEELGLKIFRGRLYVEARENRYTAFNSLGLAFLVAAGMYLGLPFLVVPFLASLGAIGIYLVAKDIGGRKAGYLAAILYGLLPTNVFISNQILDATPSFAMYLLSLGCMLAAMRNKSVVLSAVSGVALGLCFLIRQANAVYIFVFLVFLFCARKRLNLRQRLAFLLPSSVIALATVTMNKLAYGSFYHSGQVAGTHTGIFHALFPRFDPGSVVKALSNHLVAYIPLLLALGVVGYILAWRKKAHGNHKLLSIFLLVLAILTLILYASRSGTWSFEDFSITSSMARYFIPLYAVIVTYASLFLSLLSSRGREAIAVLILAAVFCSFVLFTFGKLEYMNLQKLKARAVVYDQHKESLLNTYRQPIVVFTKGMDKDLYDDVQVGLCYTQEDVERNPDIKNLFPIVDVERDVLPAIDKLLENGYAVFAASDARELLDALSEKDYQLNRAEEYHPLFLVSKRGGHE